MKELEVIKFNFLRIIIFFPTQRKVLNKKIILNIFFAFQLNKYNTFIKLPSTRVVDFLL